MSEVTIGIITVSIILSVLLLSFLKHKKDIKKYRDDI
jgi:hypothetical protein